MTYKKVGGRREHSLDGAEDVGFSLDLYKEDVKIERFAFYLSI